MYGNSGNDYRVLRFLNRTQLLQESPCKIQIETFLNIKLSVPDGCTDSNFRKASLLKINPQLFIFIIVKMRMTNVLNYV